MSRGPADLPDFELLAEIGRGGFGSVWIAKHRHTGDAVAIKFIPPRSRETELKGLQMLRQRVREGQDHLVWTEYIGESGEFIYCVMDLADNVVDGPLFPDRYEALTLLKYLKQRGRLDLVDAHEVVSSMAKGLAFLQKVGLRHGDVKPANVLRVRGRWKLADYGMMGGLDAKARGGTRSYVPPEGPHGERADQYALGIVLHELVFGRKPSKETPSWPASRVGTGLRRICERMLDPEESRRFASMGEVVEAMEALGTRRGGAASGESACPHCGEAVHGEQEVCGGCGGDLWQTCPACQHRGSVLQRFCTKCRAPVHAIAALEQELTETAALLPEGRHREVISRAEGPLADLCHEVEHQLAKMQRGDLARTRRATELRERLDGRRRRLIEQANELRAVDERIAAAHAEGLVTELRVAVESALSLLPESPNYRRLKAELPRLEAQANWNALLAELGSPQKNARQMRSAEIRRAIRTIKVRTPDDPDVRKDADRLVSELVEEQHRRLRVACLRRSAAHREAGRPVEALESLRVAESSGAADDAVRAEIAELVGSLEVERLPSLIETLETSAKGLAHSRLRRALREFAAIHPDDPRLREWTGAWRKRRRLELLRRVKDRCLAAVSSEDAARSQHHLALAYRIAGRDAALADRVLELDNALQARWGALAAAMRAAADAEVSGDVLQAYEKWRTAAEISPDSGRIAARLEAARNAAEAYPRIRRRRIAIGTMVAMLVLAAAGLVSWQGWNWVGIERWLATDAAFESATPDDFSMKLAEISDRTLFPLGTWGLEEKLQEAWWRRIEEMEAALSGRASVDAGEFGRMVVSFAECGPDQRERVEALFQRLAARLSEESPDPVRLETLSRVGAATPGISDALVSRIDAVASGALSRISGGGSVPNLGAWWGILQDEATTDPGDFASRVADAFGQRSRHEARNFEQALAAVQAAIVEAIVNGRVPAGDSVDVSSRRLDGPADPWQGAPVRAARSALEAGVARLRTLRETGRIELEVPGVGVCGFRLVSMEGTGILVGDRQIDASALADWSGGSWGDGREVSVEAIRSLAEDASIGFSTIRLRLHIPDPDEWVRCDRVLRDRDGLGIRQVEGEADDLAIQAEEGSVRAYSMPERIRIPISGPAQSGVRLLLRSN